MYFLLHHSTGTLMLDANDKSEVLSWTERQLGDAAKRAAVIEIQDEAESNWVERSGTGINKNGCEAFLSVMADSIQGVVGSDLNGFNCCLDKFRLHELRSSDVSIH
jgi:hypothetical protein